MRRALIILSIVLHNNVIGLKLPESEGSLPGLGMGMIAASRHDGGKQPVTWCFTPGQPLRLYQVENSQIPRCGYIPLREHIKQNLGGGLKVDSGPGQNNDRVVGSLQRLL